MLGLFKTVVANCGNPEQRFSRCYLKTVYFIRHHNTD